jgi:hypothetical protein
MSLNARQERFVQNLVAEGMNATAAYRAAGYAAKADSAIRADASRLLTNANVKIRVAELQREAAAKTVVTAEAIAAELDAAYELAFANNQAAACVAASMGKAKLFGLIVDRQELRAEIRKPVADPDAPAEMSIDDWTKKYGGNVIEYQR